MNNNKRISQKSPMRYMNNRQKQGYSMKNPRPHMMNYQPRIEQPPINHKLQKLTGVVLDIFRKNYINFSPSYQEIYKIIEKDPPVYYNEDSVLRIVTTVRQYYEDKLEKERPKVEPLNNNQSDSIKASNTTVIKDDLTLEKTNIRPSNRLLDGSLNPIALPPPNDGTGFEIPYKPEELMTTKIDTWTSYIVIDSKDRDTGRFSSPNDFTIDLSPDTYQSGSERKGFIRRNFHNVIAIEVISCMFLNTSGEGDSSDASNPPAYIILEIPELSRNMYGTNDILNNGLDIFTTFTTQGQYKYYKVPLNAGSYTITNKYESGIALNKLTIRYKLPNGDLYNFGDANDSNTNTVNKLILKVTHKKHMISTAFLHKETS